MGKILLLLLTFLCVSLDAYSSDPKPEEPRLLPVTLKGVIAKQPRGGVSNSLVDCYYCNGILYVDCYMKAETVYVSVTNRITGERYDVEEVDFCHSINLAVPHSPGVYYVEIEVDSILLYGYYSL